MYFHLTSVYTMHTMYIRNIYLYIQLIQHVPLVFRVS